ncbi:MAG TPA: hypothetical protein VHS03_13025 [Gaiellaceae bacterium]|nr:hypothetical protein [Gaiellaceae bacterium]
MSYVLFVSTPNGYSLHERDGDPPQVGAEVAGPGRAIHRHQGRVLPAPGRRAPLRVPAAGALTFTYGRGT